MNKQIKFFKMTAQGNNYIYLDNIDGSYDNFDYSLLSKDVSDIRFGIGSDGLIVINKDDHADCLMLIFNKDGSQAKMCGNALRCVGFYLAKKYGKKDIFINTKSGFKSVTINRSDGFVTVEMGLPKKLQDVTTYNLNASLIDIGNQHLIFNKANNNLTRNDFLALASKLQDSEEFPDGINIELIEIVSKNRIKAVVYERGSGLTYACGSGATAIFWDSYQRGFVEAIVNVELDGGILELSLRNNKVYLAGKVSLVCEGIYHWR